MKRFINPGTYGVALICFFLPFFNIKCNNSKLLTVSGFELATGANIKPATGGGMFDSMAREAGEHTDKQMFEPVLAITLLVVLAAIVVTLIMALKNRHTDNAKDGRYFAIALLILMLAEAGSLFYHMRDLDKEAGTMAGILTWHFDSGFWLLVLIAVGLIVYNTYELKNLKKTETLPPAPGTDMPTSPPSVDM